LLITPSNPNIRRIGIGRIKSNVAVTYTETGETIQQHYKNHFVVYEKYSDGIHIIRILTSKEGLPLTDPEIYSTFLYLQALANKENVWNQLRLTEHLDALDLFDPILPVLSLNFSDNQLALISDTKKKSLILVTKLLII